jgi:5'(3')-deoxyribonucleotidase
MSTIYLDMDGVVADWDAMAQKVLGKPKSSVNGRWPDSDWNKLRDHPNFYRLLSKMPRADDLVNLARRFRDELGWKLYFLTAIPHDNDVPDVFMDKVEWTQEYYPDIRVHFGPYSTDKQDHCRQGDILVDDRSDNCNQWTARGGTAVRVHDDAYNGALKELESILEKKLSMRRIAALNQG